MYLPRFTVKPAAGGQAPASLNPGAGCAVVVSPINLTLPLSLKTEQEGCHWAAENKGIVQGR